MSLPRVLQRVLAHLSEGEPLTDEHRQQAIDYLKRMPRMQAAERERHREEVRRLHNDLAFYRSRRGHPPRGALP